MAKFDSSKIWGTSPYKTFPDYDAETEMLKLEGWLCLIWDGEDPTELLQYAP